MTSSARNMDLEEIARAADTDFVSLLGWREEQGFEAKQQWPDFASATGRWEFAKDVAAMANGGGGTIVFGLSTQKLPAEQADETVEVHPIHPGSINVAAAVGILSEHILPKLRGIRIELVAGKTISPTGIVVVLVPAQPTKVILCKAMEGTTALKEYLFGYVERDRDGTQNWTREQVGKIIRTGTDAVGARLEAIEQVLNSLQQKLLVADAPKTIDDGLLKERISEVLSDD